MNPKLDVDNPASGIQLGPESSKDSVVQSLINLGVPVTRQNYLDAAGLEEPLHPELEADLPPELQKDWEETNSSETVPPVKKQPEDLTRSVEIMSNGIRHVITSGKGRGLIMTGVRQPKGDFTGENP